MVDALRTPDKRFENLSGFAFQPHYLDPLEGSGGLRMAYVDEGPPEARQTFLCLHGQPTWSYLYRKMIPVWSAAGHRVVAPDLFGFGRSDKPLSEATYTFDFHRQSLLSFIHSLDLRNITLVVHDWGGILGLTIPPHMPERFSRLWVSNTGLVTGEAPLGQGFLGWRAWCAKNPDMAVGRLMGRSCPQLNTEEQAAYDAPFPDVRYKAGIRRFPALVPQHSDDPGAALARQARTWWQDEWHGKAAMAIGMQDPVLDPAAMQSMAENIGGCAKPRKLPEWGHFVPEYGADLARWALADF
jgi:pimeloyl-ACP methyl ester carboxylesterase